MILLIAALFPGLSPFTNAQIAQNYEIATWSKFKTAAVTYTFDDNCPNQFSTVLPVLDQYKLKATFFEVINWGPNWPVLQKASANGHEVASHTMSHPASLAAQSVATQDTELGQSQNTINTNITNAKCITVAYPNCNIGDLNTIKKYYIAGRTCSGNIISSSPADFYSLGAYITGSTGSIKTAADMNGTVSAAKNSKGWCIFLTHGIDNTGDGYSPTASSELSSHFAYMNTNTTDYWVGTFRDVVRYIKERNAASLTETAINADSLQYVLSDNLDNAVYDVPITVRRLLPSGWKAAKVYNGNKPIASSLTTVSGKTYVQFDAVPDQGKSAIVNAGSVVTGMEEAGERQAVKIEPNPFHQETTLGISGYFTYTVFSLDGRYIETGMATNSITLGNTLHAGIYLVRIVQEGAVHTRKIIKTY